MSRSAPYPFAKMHGLGNDFVVIDRRGGAPAVTPGLARALADRHRGLGFDQLVEIEGDETGAHARLTFRNADGSLSGACGNATRCIAAQALAETGAEEVAFRTDRGLLTARVTEDGVAVNMGAPLLDWREIPLAREVDVDALPIPGAPLATGMGNPHCTFLVDDACAVDLAAFGPAHEHHPLFPERTNVQVAHLAGPDHVRMRVWERGAGLTLASGTSSCATVVAAHRRGLTGRRVRVTLDGGDLLIDWRDDGVWMAGPTAHVASGTLAPAFVEAAS